MTVEIILVATFAAGVFLLAMKTLVNSSLKNSRNDLENAFSRDRMETRQLFEHLQTKMDEVRAEVDKKLMETVSKNFESFNAVTKRLEEIKTVTGQVVDLSQGVRDLSRILESPKLRGSMGEFQLSEMLKQVLPEAVFEEQFSIDPKAKEMVDAVIKLKEGFLCIDSKFPLDNARRLFEENLTEDEAKVLRKAFAQDVKVMAESISEKYIIPGRTLDFAFMFIPAESIFYELMKNQDLHQFCLKKHVIPVSPNSFYAYLQAIAVGFRGLKIHEEAKKIETALSRLKKEFERFSVDFSKVGRHLKDAQTQYSNVEGRIEKFVGVIDKLGLEPGPDVPTPKIEESPLA